MLTLFFRSTLREPTPQSALRESRLYTGQVCHPPRVGEA